MAELRLEFGQPTDKRNWLRDRIALVGCAVVGSVFMFVFFVGITFIFRGFK